MLALHHQWAASDPVPISPGTTHLRLPAATRRYNFHMETQTVVAPIRRPRFRRASEPPAFRLTDDDIIIEAAMAESPVPSANAASTTTAPSTAQ
jgi:hypothetical protein